MVCSKRKTTNKPLRSYTRDDACFIYTAKRGGEVLRGGISGGEREGKLAKSTSNGIKHRKPALKINSFGRSPQRGIRVKQDPERIGG